MYKIPANTLFVGKKLIYVPECHSTNTLAIDLCQKTSLEEGATIITDHQTKGRGQRGNSWLSSKNTNLTFSVVLRPFFLKPIDQFYLTICISLAMRDFLTQHIQKDIKIKWPNDILISDKKICGILIENILTGNSIQYSVAGVGLNVNQQDIPAISFTSLKMITGKQYELATLFESLLQCIEIRYLQLKAGRTEQLREDYLKELYGRGEQKQYQDINGVFTGIIQGVDTYGKLLVSRGGETRSYDLKEIAMMSSSSTI